MVGTNLCTEKSIILGICILLIGKLSIEEVRNKLDHFS